MRSSLTPPRPRLLLGLGAVFLLVAALIVGCGGDDDDEGNNNSDATAGNTPVATATNAAGNGGAGSPADPANGGLGQGQADVDPAALESLNSFRFAVVLSGNGGAFAGLGATEGEDAVYEVKGAFVRPDRLEISTSIGGLEFATTFIGEQQWTMVGGQTVGPTAAEPVDIQDSLAILDVWDESDFAAMEEVFDCGGNEPVNGVEARKCTLNEATQEQIAGGMSGFFGGDVSELSVYDVWLTGDGIPVRLVMEVKGTDGAGEFTNRIEMDITDINGDITIEEP